MKGFRCARPRAAGLALAALASFGLAGCGDDDLGRRYPVSGRVMRQGQPVAQGTVNFLPAEAARGRAATGAIQPDGSYTLTTQDPGDGALAGDYRVVISLVDVDASKLEKTEGGIPILNQPRKVKVKNLVPAKFSDPGQTVLKYKVEPRSDNTYDIDLTE